MEVPMTAIEMTGIVDEKHQLQLDGILPFAGPKRVRVIVLSSTESPHIEIAKFTGGYSAIILGTRIKVSHIIGYLQIGETPQTITEKILPFLSVEQVLDAQKYYEHHKEEIDKELLENTEDSGKKYLREKLDDKSYKAVSGE
jgi:uncharacterized protein (DUF433 family)